MPSAAPALWCRGIGRHRRRVGETLGNDVCRREAVQAGRLPRRVTLGKPGMTHRMPDVQQQPLWVATLPMSCFANPRGIVNDPALFLEIPDGGLHPPGRDIARGRGLGCETNGATAAVPGAPVRLTPARLRPPFACGEQQRRQVVFRDHLAGFGEAVRALGATPRRHVPKTSIAPPSFASRLGATLVREVLDVDRRRTVLVLIAATRRAGHVGCEAEGLPNGSTASVGGRLRALGDNRGVHVVLLDAQPERRGAVVAAIFLRWHDPRVAKAVRTRRLDGRRNYLPCSCRAEVVVRKV
mmetsp:Transcript_49944/g.139892  ORF Transcript_49944/g.139892 Transcript_49944/m.139892 type:complete len:297 (+) Transcript_49944:1156-2046(+)